MKAVQIINVSVLLGSILVGLTSIADDKQKAVVSSGAILEGFKVSAVSTKEVFSTKEPIVLQLALENVGADSVKFVKLPLLKAYSIKIIMPDGSETKPTLYGERLLASISFSSSISDLKPSDQVKTSLHLNRLYDMTLAGTYKVFASARLPKRDGTKGNITLTSNTVEITIDENAEADKVPTEAKPQAK